MADTETALPPGGPDDFDAAVEALLVPDPEEDNPGEEESAQPETEAKAEDDQPEAEDSPEEDQAEAEDDDPEDDADDEEDQAEEQSEYVDDTAKVLDAEGNEITIGDLKAGSMRHADYTRKTQELSERNREVESTLGQLNSYAKEIVQTLTLAQELAKWAEPQPPSDEFRDSDPVGWSAAMHDYQRAKAQYEQVVNRVQSGLADTQSVTAKNSQMTDTKALEEGRKKLREAVPDLNDPNKSAALQQGVWEVAQKVGFGLDEVRGWSDPRIAHLAILASRGQKIEQAKPKAAKKVEGKPPVQKPGKRTTVKESRRRKADESFKRLVATGTEDAAVDALLHSGLLD